MNKHLAKIMKTPCVVQVTRRGEEFVVYVTGIGGNYQSVVSVDHKLKRALKRAAKGVKQSLKHHTNESITV